MDILWIVFGGLLMALGLLGCFVPVLPGPPLAFIGLWVQQAKAQAPFNDKFLWIWAGIALVVTAIDYWVPVYGTRKFGGSKYGIWGCTIGLLVGIWMGPLGIIVGPFLGAFAGEMLANQKSEHALKAALGSFFGFLVGTLLKFITCLVMTWYWIASW